MTGLRDLLESGFRGARAVVVGGGGGIGAEVVAQMRDLGADVIAASRRSAPALDINDPASRAAFISALESRFEALDILVNAAGETRSISLKSLNLLDDATIDAVTASNATSILKLIRDLAPLLRKGRSPCVVNVSSVAARTGVGSNIAYVGAKAAMDAMTISLAKALAPEVRLLNVAPSALETSFVTGRAQDFLDRTIAATPLGRLATTTEVANAVLCAARLLTMTTGATVYVDGGRHL